MSLIGKKVSDFKVQAYVKGEFKEVTQEDILGRWSVFFFYPADFTFVCPTELEDLADKYEEFQKIGCDVYSVSCDTHYVHKAWHDASDSLFFNDQYPIPGPGQINGSGKPCRAAADDHAVIKFICHYNNPTKSRLGFSVSAPGCHFAGQTSSPCSATN